MHNSPVGMRDPWVGPRRDYKWGVGGWGGGAQIQTSQDIHQPKAMVLFLMLGSTSFSIHGSYQKPSFNSLEHVALQIHPNDGLVDEH